MPLFLMVTEVKSEPMAGIYRPHIASLIQSILVGEDVSLHHALDVIGHVESY